MKLDDLRRAIIDDGLEVVVPAKDRCPVPGCDEKAVVPDDRKLYCTGHHFQCDNRQYGATCNGRVPSLGMICPLCHKDPDARKFTRQGESRRRRRR